TISTICFAIVFSEPRQNEEKVSGCKGCFREWIAPQLHMGTKTHLAHLLDRERKAATESEELSIIQYNLAAKIAGSIASLNTDFTSSPNHIATNPMLLSRSTFRDSSRNCQPSGAI
ncbi:MAG: hypothetical protein L0Z50_19175, partial [Verrucomicrobiales bacterium]|nr:hypothetical protein [Verrucomicrobiales bacterium]